MLINLFIAWILINYLCVSVVIHVIVYTMAEHLIVLLKETSLQFQSEAEEKCK